MAESREIVVCEVPKNRADAYRVTVKRVRGGTIVSIALVHKFSGTEMQVRGKAISMKLDQVRPMISALEKAEREATAKAARQGLNWLDN